LKNLSRGKEVRFFNKNNAKGTREIVQPLRSETIIGEIKEVI